MSNTKNVIKVEERLAEMFKCLPESVSVNGNMRLTPIFGYGDKKELNAFLKIKHTDRTRTPYPLIWLLYPYGENHSKTNVTVNGLSLILATQTNASMGNVERMNKTFNKVLFPLLDNINKLFIRANITSYNEEFELTKYPNYSDNESADEHAGIFIWDALKVDLDLTITDDCLKSIRF
jgi:hypothetical protein